MTAVKITEDNIFTVIIAGSWVLLALLCLAGLLFGSTAFAAGVLAGGVLAIANFYWLRTILTRALRMQGTKASRFAQLRYILRLAILGIAVYALVVHAGVSVIGLLLGLSVLVINIIALSIYMFTLKGG